MGRYLDLARAVQTPYRPNRDTNCAKSAKSAKTPQKAPEDASTEPTIQNVEEVFALAREFFGFQEPEEERAAPEEAVEELELAGLSREES
jgi:hypothetical protein